MNERMINPSSEEHPSRILSKGAKNGNAHLQQCFKLVCEKLPYKLKDQVVTSPDILFKSSTLFNGHSEDGLNTEQIGQEQNVLEVYAKILFKTISRQ